jgi:hypothetical protein
MPGTNVWSVCFYVAAIVVAVLGASVLLSMWNRFAKDAEKAIEKNVRPPSWAGPAVVTVLVVGVYLVAVTLGWNAMVNVTTSNSTYTAPAEVQEHKQVQESKLPTNDEMDAARSVQKTRAQDNPHQKALDSFDEKMRRAEEESKRHNSGK